MVECACGCGLAFPRLDTRGRARRFIHGHNGRMRRRPRPQKATPAQKFWARVDTAGECWTWTAGRSKQGYGWFSCQAVRWAAHRFSWVLHFGPIPPGIDVLHSCDNPPCVRPDHLFLGTDADNAADKESKGRGNHPSGLRHGSRTRPDRVLRGERHPGAKLTAPDVMVIRRRYAAGGVSQQLLAREFGVARSTVCAVVRGEHWRG